MMPSKDNNKLAPEDKAALDTMKGLIIARDGCESEEGAPDKTKYEKQVKQDIVNKNRD